MNRDEWVSMAEYLVWEYALHYAQFRYESSEAGPVDKAFRALTSHLSTVPVERPSRDARDAVVEAARKAAGAAGAAGAAAEIRRQRDVILHLIRDADTAEV